MKTPHTPTGRLSELLRLKAQGITPVQPTHISPDDKLKVQLLFLDMTRDESAKQRRLSTQVVLDVLLQLDPELIFDEIQMYNGRTNTRTVLDIIQLLNSEFRVYLS